MLSVIYSGPKFKISKQGATLDRFLVRHEYSQDGFSTNL